MAEPIVTTMTIHQPHYGPQGRPFAVVADGPGGRVEEAFWTEAEAWSRRDKLLDAGCWHVRVIGAPLRITVVG